MPLRVRRPLDNFSLSSILYVAPFLHHCHFVICCLDSSVFFGRESSFSLTSFLVFCLSILCRRVLQCETAYSEARGLLEQAVGQMEGMTSESESRDLLFQVLA